MRLAARGYRTGDDDLVVPGVTGSVLDASALSRRYKAALRGAALRPLRFHDLRHTFGTQAVAAGSSVDAREGRFWPSAESACIEGSTEPRVRAPNALWLAGVRRRAQRRLGRVGGRGRWPAICDASAAVSILTLARLQSSSRRVLRLADAPDASVT